MEILQMSEIVETAKCMECWTVQKGKPTEFKVNDTIFPILENVPANTDIMKTAKAFFEIFGLPKHEESTQCVTYDFEKIIQNNPDIVGIKRRNFVKYSKLKEIYNEFRQTAFTLSQAVERLNQYGGFSNPTVGAHLDYLIQKKWVVAYGKHKSRLYRFIVTPDKWNREFLCLDVVPDAPLSQNCVCFKELPEYKKQTQTVLPTNNVSEYRHICNSESDIVGKIGNTAIIKQNLLFIYNTFKHVDFTSRDIQDAHGKMRGFGAIRIYDHLKYLEKKGWVRATPRYRDGKEDIYYRFIREYN